MSGLQDQEAVTAASTEVEAGMVVVAAEAVEGWWWLLWMLLQRSVVAAAGDRTGHGFEAWAFSLAGTPRTMEFPLQQVGCFR